MKREAPASPVSGRGEHAEAAGDHSRPPGRRCRDRRTLTSAGEDFKPPASSHAAGGMQNGAAVLENSLGDSEKVNADLLYVPATARGGCAPEKGKRGPRAKPWERRRTGRPSRLTGKTGVWVRVADVPGLFPPCERPLWGLDRRGEQGLSPVHSGRPLEQGKAHPGASGPLAHLLLTAMVSNVRTCLSRSRSVTLTQSPGEAPPPIPRSWLSARRANAWKQKTAGQTS